MKALLILVLTVLSLSKVALYAVDRIMDNSNDASLIEEHKKKLNEV